MEKEVTEIREEAAKLAWYIRGGLTYLDALHLSLAERQIFGNLIKDNLETTKKTGLPFF